MRPLRLVLAGLLVVAAVVVALLAADVRSWPSALASGDSVYAATPGRASWTPSTRLGGLAEQLLGTRDDVAQRRALQLYSVAGALPQRLDNALEVQTARAQAQDALATAARDPDPQRAAQARTLLGILTFGASSSGGSSRTRSTPPSPTSPTRSGPIPTTTSRSSISSCFCA